MPGDTKLLFSIWLSAIAAAALPASCLFAGEGELARIRREVRRDPQPAANPSPPPSEPDHPRPRYDFSRDRRRDDWWAKPVATIVGGALTSPFWGPPLILGDNYAARGYFPKFPYEGDLEGFMMIAPWVPEHPYPWATRATLEYASTYDDLNSLSGRLQLDTRIRWGLDSELNYRTETTPTTTDELFTGDLNLVFRFAQTPRVQMRGGLGFNWLADQDDTDFGVNFTYGGDWFPRRPWVISADFDGGKVGNATLLHVRTTLGVQFQGAELYIGYDFYDVDKTEISSLVSGVRVWF